MLKIYDKAQWHIDGGEKKEIIVDKMKNLFSFLDSKGLLTNEGKEIMDIGIDASVSIHEKMLTEIGNRFMDKCYDACINYDCSEILSALENEYKRFVN